MPRKLHLFEMSWLSCCQNGAATQTENSPHSEIRSSGQDRESESLHEDELGMVTNRAKAESRVAARSSLSFHYESAFWTK